MYTRTKIVDKNTGLPLRHTGIIVDQGGQRAEFVTDQDGCFGAPPADALLLPADGHAFDSAMISIGDTSTAIEVSARFMVTIHGSGSPVVRLHFALDPDQLRDVGDDPASRSEPWSGAIALGETIHEWPVPGSYWPMTSNEKMVLSVDTGTIEPSHPVWSGLSTTGEDGTRHLRVPDLVTPPRVSAPMAGRPGSAHEFTVTKSEPVSMLEFIMDGPVSRPGRVQLLRVSTFQQDSLVAQQVAEQLVGRDTLSIGFQDLVPGEYVVRSALHRDPTVFLSWQKITVGAGVQVRCLERVGIGQHAIAVDGARDGDVALSIVCGVHDGLPITYGGVDLGGVQEVSGLRDAAGSLRVYASETQNDIRLSFDRARNHRLAIR